MADLPHTLRFLQTYSAGGKHVRTWIADLDGAPDEQPLMELLDAHERQRAAAFRFAVHRKRFVVARAWLRMLLAASLACDPKKLRFTYGPWGKPVLDNEAALSFNIAHSEGLAVYALGERIQIGVDVEQRRPLAEAAALAARYFSSAERSLLASTPIAARDEAFLRCWTRKEAYLKALGEGLHHPLDAFDVSAEPPSWRLFDLDLPCAAVGALAVCLAS